MLISYWIRQDNLLQCKHSFMFRWLGSVSQNSLSPIESECSSPWMIKNYDLNFSVPMCLSSLNFKRVFACVFVTCLQNNRVKMYINVDLISVI